MKIILFTSVLTVINKFFSDIEKSGSDFISDEELRKYLENQFWNDLEAE